eukprot:3515983-Lingulodinium_polyedra.AAC.1
MAAGHSGVCDALPRWQCAGSLCPSGHAAKGVTAHVPGEPDPDAITRAIDVQPEPDDERMQPVT